jgi:hypothetical protein
MKIIGLSDIKTRQQLPAVVLAVSAAAIILVGVIPQYKRLLTVREEILKQSRMVESLENKLLALRSLDKSSQSSDLDLVLSAFPIDEPFYQSLVGLSSLGQRHQAVMSQFKFEFYPPSFSLNFTLTGPMNNLQSFISDAERILPLAGIEHIDIVDIGSEEKEASGSGESYRSGLKAIIYWSPPPAAVGRVSDPLPVISGDLFAILEQLRGFENFLSTAVPANAGVIGTSSLFPE